MGEDLTPALLRAVLDYNTSTGLFVWRERSTATAVHPNRWNATWAGRPAGSSDSKGYLRIAIHKRFYKAHRLAWLFVYGEWPPHEIDHIDGDRANNAISNLREATTRQNQQNKTGKRRSAPYRGVRRQNSKWRAEICVDGEKVHLGMYDTPEQAGTAYADAAARHHGDFAYSRRYAEGVTPNPPEVS